MSTQYLQFLITLSARTAVVLFIIALGLRIMGKRQIGQMNIYDLAMIMALANAVQNAMTAGKGDISVGIVSAGTLLLISWLMAQTFVRLPTMERVITGVPTVLVSNGEIIHDHLRREGVTRDQLLMALRQNELTDPKEAALVILERDGLITVVPKEQDAAS